MMRKKSYWKIRKVFHNATFCLKKIWFKVVDSFEIRSENRSFRVHVALWTLKVLVSSALIALLLLALDTLFSNAFDFPEVRNDLFINVIVGGIGVSGVVLTLYYSNITSIYSAVYSNAPNRIKIAFQRDTVLRRSITAVVDYIAFGLFVVLEELAGYYAGWATLCVFAFWSLMVIVGYSFVGNRAYQLSDVYKLASDPHRMLCRIISKELKMKPFSSDDSFQKHFMKITYGQLELLNELDLYAGDVQKVNNSSVVDFMGKNIALLDLYWKNKGAIEKNSFWFREEVRYPKWHGAGHTESSIALQTGTALKYKSERDYWWIEDELMRINRSCIKRLLERRDYLCLYNYLQLFTKLAETAVQYKEVVYYCKEIEWIITALKTHTAVAVDDGKENLSAGLAELAAVLNLELIISANKYYQGFSLGLLQKGIIKELDRVDDVDQSSVLRNRMDASFYNKIIKERIVEGTRVTPAWLINQKIAHEEYDYLNCIIKILESGIECTIDLARVYYKNEKFFEACIVLNRLFEYESKMDTFIGLAMKKESDFNEYLKEKEFKWDEFNGETIKSDFCVKKKEGAQLFLKCSSSFAANNWSDDMKYPDFLGECYNHICEDAIKSIVNNDLDQYRNDYEIITSLILLYQEYIKKDFTDFSNPYKVQWAYQIITSPTIEWAQIGGLAIIWGEFFPNENWKDAVIKAGEKMLYGNIGGKPIIETQMELIRFRESGFFAMTTRDFIETGWKQQVASAIRDIKGHSVKYDMVSWQPAFDSKLINAFCREVVDLGITKDPAEVFWVICVNPLLREEKRFVSKTSWERKLNE